MEEALALIIVVAFIGVRELSSLGKKTSVDDLRKSARGVLENAYDKDVSRMRGVGGKHVTQKVVPSKVLHAFFSAAESAYPSLSKDAKKILGELLKKKHMYLDKDFQDHSGLVDATRKFLALPYYSATAESNVYKI